ncbi:SGNH/GDSL hydrolase family protein [Candidatus Omnitrophota bacterium]
MKRFIFSITIVLIPILFLEVGFRIFTKELTSAEDSFQLRVCEEILGEYDDDLFWRLKGVKPDFKTVSGKESLKIICLSDSVSIMNGDKDYPNILQVLLSKALPKENPIVFNGGVPGYTSFQGLKYFTNELLSYYPDVVIVCYGWNDHWQSSNKLSDKLQKSPKNKFIKNIIGSSRMLSHINALALKIKQRRYKRVGPEQFVRVSLEDYKYNLSEFIDICKNKNILIILMTAPYLDREGEWIPLHKEYNSIVRQVALKENVKIIDLVETFVDREDLFIEPKVDYVHYNWRGSQIVAQALADVISDLKLN